MPEYEDGIIWIDTESGTWGTSAIEFVNLQTVVNEDNNEGNDTDVASYLAALDSMTDSERIEFANRYHYMAWNNLNDK